MNFCLLVQIENFCLLVQIDSPLGIQKKGMAPFLKRLDNLMTQNYRDCIFRAESEDLVDVCERYEYFLNNK